MSRVLLLILLVLGVIWWVGRRRQPPPEAGPAPAAPPAAKPAATIKPMLRCAQCGLHLPQDDVLTDAQGLAYCSEAHRALGPAGPSS
ncbi:MAG TPA: PP0621 family protein [Ideonella sp.]|uniref:PP0621 family protein n=1 Tax=Ideonella sp. TaxID=1929293 RepID=UPI002C362725|nr:PP0621 family protein [Ideonella sp.]HSI48323.1 PP0621 family protein [Ideonella sp.]